MITFLALNKKINIIFERKRKNEKHNRDLNSAGACHYRYETQHYVPSLGSSQGICGSVN